MGFWAALGNIAKNIGIQIAGALLSGDRDQTRREVVQMNWTDVVRTCNSLYDGNLDPISAVGNMRRSLYEQDPQVLRMALKVLELVLEERGIPAHNEEEASEFLRDMRHFLRDARDRGVDTDGVFELNQVWSRASRNSSAFQGVSDLIDLLNAEGYRVLVTRGNRSITNENEDFARCSSCNDFQLAPDRLKHFCQYCCQVFCSNCCSYQPGIPPFQENSSVCICHQCKDNNNSNFSQHAISTMKSENDDNSGKNKKENNGVNRTLEHAEEITSVKSVWQEEDVSRRLNNRKIECKDENLKVALEQSKQAELEEKRMRLAIEASQQEYQNKEEVLCRRNNQEAECEEEELRKALELSKQTEMEDWQMRVAIEASQREYQNEVQKFSEYMGEVSDEDVPLQDTRRQAPKTKKNTKYRLRDSDEDYDEDLKTALRRSLEETEMKNACYNCGKGECVCEEADTLARALELSRRESTSREGSCTENDLTDMDDMMWNKELRPKAEEQNENVHLNASRMQNFVSGESGGIESTNKPSLTEDELRQKRLRYFQRENTKEELKSEDSYSQEEAEFSEASESSSEEGDSSKDSEDEQVDFNRRVHPSCRRALREES